MALWVSGRSQIMATQVGKYLMSGLRMCLTLAYTFVPERSHLTKTVTLNFKSFTLAGRIFCVAMLALSGDLLAKDQSEAPEVQAQSEAEDWLNLFEFAMPTTFAIQYRSEHGKWPSERDLLESAGLPEEYPQAPLCAVAILGSSDDFLEMEYTSSFSFFYEPSIPKKDNCPVSIVAEIARTEELDNEQYDAKLEVVPVRSVLGLRYPTWNLKSTCKPPQQCKTLVLEMLPPN